jgi:hypothetical protein
MKKLLIWVSILLQTLSNTRHIYSLLLLRSTFPNCIINGVNYAQFFLLTAISKMVIMRMIAESIYVFKSLSHRVITGEYS